MKRIPWGYISAFILILWPPYTLGVKMGMQAEVGLWSMAVSVLSVWIGAVILFEGLKTAAARSAREIIKPFARTHMQSAVVEELPDPVPFPPKPGSVH